MMEEAFVACDMCRYHTTAQKLVEAELDMLVSWIPLCIPVLSHVLLLSC